MTFSVTDEGFSERGPSRVSVRAFPGGNNWAISLAGQSPIERTMSCVFADRAAYVALVLLRGTQATLVVDAWDSVTAVLNQTSASTILPSGEVLASAEFVLV